MKVKDFKELKLPDSSGVYFFKDTEGNILYIGRATSLFDRVSSYFKDDLIKTRGPLIVDMVIKSQTVEYIKTDSVLEAIILENNEIKKYQPYFNTKEKDNKSYSFVIITKEEFGKVLIVREREIDRFEYTHKFGPYPQLSILKEALKIIRKIFPFRDGKSKIPHNESFYRSLGLSPNLDSKEARKDYENTLNNLILFFEGKKGDIVKKLEKEMNKFVEMQEFEKAVKNRNIIYSLNHIKDISLIKYDDIKQGDKFKIEAYDIAHMSGLNTVGVMTVIIDGQVNKDQYRKFKISKDINNDTLGLKEILERRLKHTEWSLPNLIVVDGGISQFNTAKEILKKNNLSIDIVSVVKDSRHKPRSFLGNEVIIKKYSKDILLANDEAHRFAIGYHKKLRTKKFIPVDN